MRVSDHNIDQAGRNRRMLLGLLFFSLGLGLAVFFVKAGVPAGYRALTFLPFWAGGLMVFQSAYRTCVMLAARHEHSTEHGVERVVNREQIEVDGDRVRAIFRASTLVAVVATALLFLLP